MLFRRTTLLVCLTLLLGSERGSSAEELLTPAADAPRYQLSNLRAERDRFSRTGIAMDFQRTRTGDGPVLIRGKSSKGQLSISASVPASQDSGTIRLESLFGGDISAEIELYLVQEHRLSASKSIYSLVSNAVRLGNPGAVSTSRAWTAEEKTKHTEFMRIMNDDSAHKPPQTYPVTVQVPESSEFVPNTAKLTKGTRLHACYQNKWYALTTLSENDDGTVNIRWDAYGARFDGSMNRGELVIATNLLSSLGKHPASRFPETVPNWATESAKTTAPAAPAATPASSTAKGVKQYPVRIAIPNDSELVPKDLKLKPGVPLQACYARKWCPITTLGENDDGTLTVRWDEYGSAFDCSMIRDELIIKKKLAQQLRTNPSSVKVAPPTVAAIPHKEYPVSIAVPSDSVLVPKDAALKPGTKLQACYSGKWNPMTFLSTNSDGTLNVRWDDYGPSFDCSMVRNELIIKRALLKESKPSKPTRRPAAEVRTFTDATGRFKVQAKAVKVSETQVTLLTDKGKELTLPLSKLSKADQEYLRSRADSESPLGSTNP